MTDLTLESLAERLAPVERQNRRLRAIAILVVGVLAATVCMGQVITLKVVEAQSFVVRDAAGKARARLSVNEDGPALTLIDQDGRPRATLRLGEDGFATLDMFDDKGERRAVPTISADQLLTPEQRALMRRLETEFAPELRRINNALADFDERLVAVEDWIADQPASPKAEPKPKPKG